MSWRDGLGPQQAALDARAPDSPDAGVTLALVHPTLCCTPDSLTSLRPSEKRRSPSRRAGWIHGMGVSVHVSKDALNEPGLTFFRLLLVLPVPSDLDHPDPGPPRGSSKSCHDASSKSSIGFASIAHPHVCRPLPRAAVAISRPSRSNSFLEKFSRERDPSGHPFSSCSQLCVCSSLQPMHRYSVCLPCGFCMLQ